jgi:hypothetical protein
MSDEYYNELKNVHLLETFVKSSIQQIKFCGIEFRFLNYSASQIKQKSWWNYVDNNSLANSSSQDKVPVLFSHGRDEFNHRIGVFKDDDKPLKKLARQGQSMSSSTFVADVKSSQVTVIEDVEGNDDFVFTDGCGYISEELLKSAAEKFDLEQVSAIQMRYSGFKGVLVLHPGLKGKSIVFRKSQEKFVGNMTELSVIRCATYSPAYLNR